MLATLPRSALAILMLLAVSSPARSQPADGRMTLGVAAPLAGASEILGRQIASGVTRAAEEADVTVVPADTDCTAEGGARAAKSLVSARVSAAVGFLCTASLEAALPILTAASIPVVNVGVRAERILRQREKDGALVWRLAPGSDAEASAIARFVRERWAAASFAIVEDGSAYGRDMADTVRRMLEDSGLRPALIDNYRPAEEKQFAIARRIQQSGVSRVLFFGTRGDIAIVLRDAAESGFEIEAAGGESLNDDSSGGPPLPVGTTAIVSGFDVDWPPSETPPEDEGYARLASIGAEVAIDAARRARSEGRSVADVLNAETFVTSAGLVRFQGDGTAEIVPFRAYRWDGARFVAENES